MKADSQAVHDGASLSTLPLPVVDLSQKAKEGFLRVRHVTVRGPAQELEVTHHQLAFLELLRIGEVTGVRVVLFLLSTVSHHIWIRPLVLHTSHM